MGDQLEILIELVGKALGSLKRLGVFVGSQMSYPVFTTFEPTHFLEVRIRKILRQFFLNYFLDFFISSLFIYFDPYYSRSNFPFYLT